MGGLWVVFNRAFAISEIIYNIGQHIAFNAKFTGIMRYSKGMGKFKG